MKATPGGAPPPQGRSSRASAQKYPVLVLRVPGSSTGARVSSMKSLVERFRSAISASKTGRNSKAARPTQSASVERSRSIPWRLHDLRLPIQGKMIGIFADQHMRDRCFGRQPAWDQTCRRRGLNDAVGAGAAGIFRAAGDDDAELGRDTSSRSDTSSPMQCRQPPQAQIRLSGSITSSIRGRCFGREPRLAARGLAILFASRSVRLFLGMDRGNGRFQVFQRQIELVRDRSSRTCARRRPA